MNQIFTGDALAMLRTLPDNIVQCCVTSPPYWGLRDYHMDDQLGLEATPDEYVAKLVEIMGEVRRVLRDDGTLWLNLGDSYATKPYGDNHSFDPKYGGRNRSAGYPNRQPITGIRPKNLIGIPWRVAFALQADGWYLRSDIIWHKPNAMPESVTDRPSKAHEYIFLLSKSEKYFYDNIAIQERSICGDNGSSFTAGKTKVKNRRPVGVGERVDDGWRNRRSVWSVATTPYPEAHFATYPAPLITPYASLRWTR